MTITVDWHDDDKSTIVVSQGATWSWKEVRESIDEAYTMVKGVDHIVYIIVDNSQATQNTAGSGLSTFRYAMENQPDNLAKLVVITDNRFMLPLPGVLEKAFAGAGAFAKMVGSKEEALAYIKEAKATGKAAASPSNGR
ncbi:MAG: hypothetical protein ACFB51_20340 [Anaerolineae bacterium]